MNQEDTLQAFIETDIENLRKGPEIFRGLHPSLMDLLELCNELFLGLLKEFGEADTFSSQCSVFLEWKKKYGLKHGEAADLLINAVLLPGGDDETEKAKAEIEEAMGAVVRAFLIARVQRDFLYGARIIECF